jgi:hypothetical protein
MARPHRLAALLAAAALVASGSVARAAEQAAAPAPEELARKLLELTSGADLGKQAMTQVLDALRGVHPDVPDAFWDEFEASVDPEELEELVVPIYVDNLSVEEMNAAIEFYSSPLGRSLVQKLPAIMSESMAVGQQWGARLAEEVVERLANRPPARPDA